jgi:hypothetical protein
VQALAKKGSDTGYVSFVSRITNPVPLTTGSNENRGGRFTEQIDAVFERFNNSFGIDRRLVLEDIEGSLAYANALSKAGILSEEELKQIGKGLVEIKKRIEKEPAWLGSQSAEDVHSFVEARLVETIGDAGFKLHTGRSRNDQVALDTRLYLKRAIIHVQVQIRNLNRELLNLAKANLDVVIPGYTHLRKAQPILFAHYLLAYFEMFQRDYDRLDDCFRGRMPCRWARVRWLETASPSIVKPCGLSWVSASSLETAWMPSATGIIRSISFRQRRSPWSI